MASNPSSRMFFDSTKRDGLAFLQSLFGKSEGEENEWLEYKGAEFLSQPKKPKTSSNEAFDPEEKLKQIWSKALSAFANSGGGVLVWGIDCQGKVPTRFSFAPNCDELRLRLRDLILGATDPAVTNVEFQTLRETSDCMNGVVLCLVPQSDFPPHVARWAGERYFVRDHDKSIPCPTGLLRALFYPRSNARMGLNCSIQKHGSSTTVTVAISNRGPGTAQSLVILVVNHGGSVTFAPGWEMIEGSQNAARCAFPVPPQMVIHGVVRVQLFQPLKSLQINCYTHDCPLQIATICVSEEEAEQLDQGEVIKQRAPFVPSDWDPFLGR